MNAITIVILLFSVIIYGLLLHHLLTFPEKVFVSMKMQLLKSLYKEEASGWKRPSSDSDESAASLWNYFQDRALDVLGHKKRYLAKTIFLQGGFVLFSLIIISCPLVFHTGFNVAVIIPKTYYLGFLFAQIPIFLRSYFYHLKNFDSYMIIGGQEHFLEEAKEYLGKIQNNV